MFCKNASSPWAGARGWLLEAIVKEVKTYVIGCLRHQGSP